jgi:hypothetical protein
MIHYQLILLHLHLIQRSYFPQNLLHHYFLVVVILVVGSLNLLLHPYVHFLHPILHLLVVVLVLHFHQKLFLHLLM